MSDPGGPSAELSGWGGYPVVVGHERLSEDLEAITGDAVLTRGLGRSYGDASLPPPGLRPVAGSRLANRILSFDTERGLLRAEAGLAVGQLNEVFWPRGWTSPVLPGTQHVTLGGLVAADAHGKNHHVEGSFGEHVRKLRLRVAGGRILEIDDGSERELFRATLGGMGLTGHILEVEVQLSAIPTCWILQESERIESLERLLSQLDTASREWPFTVAWSDAAGRGAAFGRGVLIKGRWARPDEAPARAPHRKRVVAVPFVAPNGLLAPWNVRLFNQLYFRKHPRGVERRCVHPQSFFHPLDVVGHWNRMYGSRGFTQYQCVLPHGAESACRGVLELPLRHGLASFLTVIKDCGEEGRGMLSFPMRGISIAMDIPVVGNRTEALVAAMNQAVMRRGGRIYLAKDALTRAEHFRAMEPRLESWNEVRRRWDPTGELSSALSVRLFGDSA